MTIFRYNRKDYRECNRTKIKRRIWSISFKMGKVSEERFNLIEQIINENKDLGTTVNNERCTLNDANDLVNKILKKKGW